MTANYMDITGMSDGNVRAGSISSLQILLSIGLIISWDEAIFLFIPGQWIELGILAGRAGAEPDLIPP